MSALRQPDFSTNFYQPQPLPQDVANPSSIVPPLDPVQTGQLPVKTAKLIETNSFRNANTLPQKLQTLSLIQKVSFGMAIATMTASISLYVSTVKIPKLWSQEYQHLENLQLQERQLVAVNETIKYQIAQEASHDNHLTIAKPESSIFLHPAKVPARSAAQLKQSQQLQQQTAELKYNSLGY